MATSQQLMQLMNNPNARKMLDLIAAAEGVKYGYNTLFGNQRIDNLSAHPNIKKPFKQTDGQVKYTTAAGRYQFLKDTWDGLARQYGIKDFSPQSQDFGALALLAQNGALPYVLKGDFNTAIKKSGSTWASLPTSPYAQNKRSWDFIDKQLGSTTTRPQSFEPEFIDLKKVGIGQNFQPKMVDLASVGIGTKSDFQPEFVDLKSVGIGV
ncbi:glycoside hydrolase family 24 protein [Acinetobacter baumannii]|uniref:glycoside hydrolase family 24 protein n=2 Tax=Acinetobacter baumannii TaxID=470 RepID=UPI000DE6296F|nr:glycoside hydrolase family 104 protein [Acinetobacter baumannii]MCE6432708.1 glycoside hydrolase family 104 protein [Acinetobacter baumannii]MCJ8793829.1 glycoside hydrolase family 104 protein [Acinetobacter baumannii]MCJ8903874.1 glycoside hydrolase family 104 protein [Acinetobacter baumannii]MCJ9372663.1 glycoside hydrolase family 104 protein [Acinetobacter baumannii]MCJ9474391.1 glycoside hydrolase family 104 protein [Acinetobacter baumannii]